MQKSREDTDVLNAKGFRGTWKTTVATAVQEWMVKKMYSFTPSAAKFFFDKYPQEASLFMFGHTEAITEEMCKEYIEWCQTDEGRSYLKGGANYKEDGGDD